jgi:hypothetical protein
MLTHAQRQFDLLSEYTGIADATLRKHHRNSFMPMRVTRRNSLRSTPTPCQWCSLPLATEADDKNFLEFLAEFGGAEGI